MPRLSVALPSVLLSTFFSAFLGLGCSTLFPDGGGGSMPVGTITATGCAVTGAKHVAPGGYYVNGNTVCSAAGSPHLFHGVDRPSLEWSSSGENLSASDFQLMGSWKANVVRIALNQDFWIPTSPFYDATYAPLVDSAIGWAEDAGLDVILDLHWSDAGTLGSCTSSCQQLMADTNSLTFWSDVAARYKGDGRVLFELYNEPHDIAWGVWQSGGMTTGGWQAAGMQQLYAAVRAADADNLVVIGGVDFAYDLSGVRSHHISGYNIMYATHPYNGSPERDPQNWDSSWGYLTATDPVIVTEFGDPVTCMGTYSSEVIAYADLHGASWTSWAWFPGGCNFPSIIGDWNGTPTDTGMVIKTALAGYHDPAPGGARDGGPPPPDAGSSPADGGKTPADGGNGPGEAGASESDGGTG